MRPVQSHKPAALLTRKQATLVPNLTTATLERAERLFIRLNSLIRTRQLAHHWH